MTCVMVRIDKQRAPSGVSDDTYRDSVCVLLPYPVRFGLAFVERVLVLELGTHDDGVHDWKMSIVGIDVQVK
jgi:hypothetical protein